MESYPVQRCIPGNHRPPRNSMDDHPGRLHDGARHFRLVWGMEESQGIAHCGKHSFRYFIVEPMHGKILNHAEMSLHY